VIYVRPPILTEEEWAMGESVCEHEWRARYQAVLAPEGSRNDMQTADQGSAGSDADAGAAAVSGVGEAVGGDALQSEEWLGDSNRVIDREVYG
jgi:hypothetical protein